MRHIDTHTHVARTPRGERIQSHGAQKAHTHAIRHCSDCLSDRRSEQKRRRDRNQFCCCCCSWSGAASDVCVRMHTVHGYLFECICAGV